MHSLFVKGPCFNFVLATTQIANKRKAGPFESDKSHPATATVLKGNGPAICRYKRYHTIWDATSPPRHGSNIRVFGSK